LLAITSGLLRYDLKNIPVNQPIPDAILNKRIPIHIQNNSMDNELFTHIFKVIAKNMPISL